MQVKELIEELHKRNLYSEVLFENNDGDYEVVFDIETREHDGKEMVVLS